MIKFACFSPHPPLLLPNVGTEEDKEKVKKTIKSLGYLAELFKQANPDTIIISSPHPDWGFNVPLHFLAKHFKEKINKYLTEEESPREYFSKGKDICRKLKGEAGPRPNYALIASGDLSHCLKEEGPYGFHPDGPKFDKALIEFLKKKDIENILKLDEMYPQAGECGLRSFSFILGILEEAKINWQPEILSYEAPFGVGYLVVNIKNL